MNEHTDSHCLGVLSRFSKIPMMPMATASLNPTFVEQAKIKKEQSLAAQTDNLNSPPATPSVLCSPSPSCNYYSEIFPPLLCTRQTIF